MQSGTSLDESAPSRRKNSGQRLFLYRMRGMVASDVARIARRDRVCDPLRGGWTRTRQHANARKRCAPAIRSPEPPTPVTRLRSLFLTRTHFSQQAPSTCARHLARIEHYQRRDCRNFLCCCCACRLGFPGTCQGGNYSSHITPIYAGCSSPTP